MHGWRCRLRYPLQHDLRRADFPNIAPAEQTQPIGFDYEYASLGRGGGDIGD